MKINEEGTKVQRHRGTKKERDKGTKPEGKRQRDKGARANA
jgi:hypothetical protein